VLRSILRQTGYKKLQFFHRVTARSASADLLASVLFVFSSGPVCSVFPSGSELSEVRCKLLPVILGRSQAVKHPSTLWLFFGDKKMLTARSSGLKRAGPNLDILDENTEHF